jgi:ATPase components of ABC transporters with duplicated ATPase domains
MISINDVTVAYGSFTLLDNISVHISESDKIGLVGKNGAGKSTLMKLITGEQSPTSGHIDMPADVQIGYLPQIMEHHKGRSVINEVMTVFDHLHDMERELERINVQLAERTDYESADYARLIDRLNVINDRLALETGESPRVRGGADALRPRLRRRLNWIGPRKPSARAGTCASNWPRSF